MKVDVLYQDCLKDYRAAFPELLVRTVARHHIFYSACPQDGVWSPPYPSPPHKTVVWRTKTPHSYYQRFPIVIMYTIDPPVEAHLLSHPSYSFFTNPNPIYTIDSTCPISQSNITRRDLFEEDPLPDKVVNYLC